MKSTFLLFFAIVGLQACTATTEHNEKLQRYGITDTLNKRSTNRINQDVRKRKFESQAAYDTFIEEITAQMDGLSNDLRVVYRGSKQVGYARHLYFEDVTTGSLLDFGEGKNDLAYFTFYDSTSYAPNKMLTGQTFEIKWAFVTTHFACCDDEGNKAVGEIPSIISLAMIDE